MKTTGFSALLCAMIFLAAPERGICQTDKANDTGEVTKNNTLRLGNAITHENLTIFPVCSSVARTVDRFSVLDDGLEKGTVIVLEKEGLESYLKENGLKPNKPKKAEQETSAQQTDTDQQQLLNAIIGQGSFGGGGGNDVNELYVINKTDKPLYLMPGQILLGGDQDRMIAKETIVPKGIKPHPVAVFCVEQGRWGGREIVQTTRQLAAIAQRDVGGGFGGGGPGGGVAPSYLEAKVAESNMGKFVANAGNASGKVRRAAQIGKGQSDVWEKVDKFNKSNQTDNSTQTFTHNLTDAKAVKERKPYLDAIGESVAATTNVVGVIVAINGEVESVDVFESTPLFKKMWPRLAQGFAMDAASNQPGKKKPAKVCDQKTAKQFLAKTMGGKVTSAETSGKLQVQQLENDSVISISSRYGDADESAAGGFGGGGFGGAVHSAGFSK